jgi:hypothetical protein
MYQLVLLGGDVGVPQGLVLDCDLAHTAHGLPHGVVAARGTKYIYKYFYLKQ